MGSSLEQKTAASLGESEDTCEIIKDHGHSGERMEFKQENKGLNLVIVQKETKWGKFKRQVRSLFSKEKTTVEPVVIPDIVVTSAEESSTGCSDAKPKPNNEK